MQTQINVNLVDSLKDKASKSPAFSAMCTVFAIRERTRQQITMSSLIISMLREGFKYSRSEYEDALRFMSDLGLGTLVKDSKGKVRALKDIKTTLQSIGTAAISEGKLKNFHPKVNFMKIPQSFQEKIDVKPPKIEKVPDDEIVIKTNGKEYSFKLPTSAGDLDLLEVVSRIYGKSRG